MKSVRLTKFLPVAATVILFVLSFALTGSYLARLAYASFASWGDTSLIHACENSRGAITLITAGGSCNGGETQVTWLKDVDAGSGLSISRGSSGATISALTNTDGWTSASETWTYASSTTITVPSDATTKYAPGDKIRLKQGGSYKYFYVTGVTSTVLTVTGGSDYSVANSSITDNYYSHQVSPVGFPQWFNFSPSWSGGTMSISSVVNGGSKFTINGRDVHVLVAGTFTTGGTATSGLNVGSLPVNPDTGSSQMVGAAYINDGSGSNIQQVFADSTQLKLINDSNITLTSNVSAGTNFTYSY